MFTKEMHVCIFLY